MSSSTTTSASTLSRLGLRLALPLAAVVLAAGCASPRTQVANVTPPPACQQAMTRVVYEDGCRNFDRYGACYSNGLQIVARETVCAKDRCDTGHQWSNGQCIAIDNTAAPTFASAGTGGDRSK